MKIQWNGELYTESGNYTFSTTNSLGCDSTALLEFINFLNSNSITQTISECNSYTWIDGITYNESNSNATHIHVELISICADTFYLELTILPESESQSNVTNCDSFAMEMALLILKVVLIPLTLLMNLVVIL